MEPLSPALSGQRDSTDRRDGDQRDGSTSNDLYRRLKDKLGAIERERRRHISDRRQADRRRDRV